MPYSTEAKKIVILGSTGRLGQIIYPFWQEQHTVWHSRRPKQGYQSLEILKDKKGFIELLKGSYAVLCLAGITPSSSSLSFQHNSSIAAACLDAAKTADVSRVFLTSSAAVYGNQSGLLSETDQLNPVSEYGRSKAEMENLALKHKQTSTVLRIGNVAGADAILGGWHPKMKIDTFPDGSTPRRSYVGPETLAKVIQKLFRIENLPAILNLASPKSIHMNELLDHANLTYARAPATDKSIADVTLDTSLLEKYVTFRQEDCSAESMVAQWKRT
ncbi:MAG: NAD(P)-dependent oxidoreductase [Lentilitoribacter sp.]